MLSQSLLPEFDLEMANTRKTLERVPEDAQDWKPHEKSFSMGDLAAHLANILTWVGLTIGADELDLEGTGRAKRGTRDETLALFDRNVVSARELIEGASDEELLGMWSLRSGDTVLGTMPRIAVLRSFVMSHMIHHRGQLTVYLRLRDVPVPSIYGPSADERPF